MKSKTTIDAAQADNPNVVAPVPLKSSKLAGFALPTNFEENLVQSTVTAIRVGKPAKDVYVRTSKDESHWTAFGIIETETDRNLYLCTPAITLALSNQEPPEKTLVCAKLVLSVDRLGTPFFWMLKQSTSDNRWLLSAQRAAVMARDLWVRVVANQKSGAYDCNVATSQEGEPTWPKESYLDLLEIAFADRLIEDMDHPVLRGLRGEKV